jgi:tight adherence protein B
VGCLLLLAALVALAKPRGAWLRSRLEPYATAAGDGSGPSDRSLAPAAAAGWLSHADRLYGATERELERTRLAAALRRLLERAHLQVRPAQLLFWSTATGVALAVLAGFATSSPVLLVAAFAGGVGSPLWWVAARGRKRMRAFDDQLPDVLMTMAGSLKVGQSFDHSMRAIVDEGLAPSSEEFGRVLNETRLGRPVDEALEAMADRIGSEELRFVIMSVTIQREVGGSLADLFQTVSDTVRARQQFRRKVHALTAMGRASAYVLVALPLVTAALIALANPGYLAPLVQQPAGQVMLVAIAAMTIVGAFLLKKIVSIKG